MLDIGLEVKILRERLQMSAKELAERIGLSQSQMSRLEKGQRRIDATVLAKIADALGVEPSHFFGGAAAPPDGVVPPARPSSVGKLIRAERRQRHVSAEELAARLSIPRPRLLAIEEGKRALDPELAEKIARALRLPANCFLKAQHETILALEAQIERLNQALAESHRGGAVDGASRPGIPVLNTLPGGYPRAFDALGRPAAEPDDFVHLPGVQEPEAFGLLVVGDSMTASTSPSFAEGDLVIFAAGALRSRDFAFVRLAAGEGGGAGAETVTFRQVFFESQASSRVRLQPLNLNHPPSFHRRDEILSLWRLVAHVARY